MIASWDDRYPDKKTLRREVDHMVEAFVEVLLEEIPESDMEGIYFKGSAQKHWDSPLDYVPELSDVDIHLLFADDTAIGRHLGSIPGVTHIQSRVEETYFSKEEKPLHVPRPQIVVLNQLLQEEDYVPTPEKAVSVLYGKDYPKGDYTDQDRIRLIDCKRVLQEEKFLSELPSRVIDKPSRYIWDSLRALVWHVSPVAPRVLHMLGLPTEKAWSINRTEAVSYLREKGEDQLAQHYSQFYLHGWKYFLSKYSDTDAGRSTQISGVNALREALEISKAWFVEHSQSYKE